MNETPSIISDLDLIRRLSRDLVHFFDDAHAHAGSHAHDLDSSWTYACTLIYQLADELSLARTLAAELHRARPHEIDLGRIRELARRFDLDSVSKDAHDHNLYRELQLARAHTLLNTLNSILNNLDTSVANNQQINNLPTANLIETPVCVTVASSAKKLIHLAMRILPDIHRERYIEEFHAELWELASAKATRSVQLLYAVQQLGRVWQLRYELKTPGRRRAEMLRQATCWVLTSQTRTWGMISIAIVAALFDVVVQQGPGSAFLAIPTLYGFHSGVKWIRKRLGVEAESRKTEDR